MAIAASSVTPTNSLEDFRIEFNNLVSDVTGITATNKFTENIIFEGATADAHETTLTVTDPTADRTITLPNETGTVFTSGGNIALGGSITKASDLTVDIEGDISLDANGGDIYLKDGGTIYGTLTNNGGNLTIKNSSAEVAAISIAGDEVVTFADDIVIKDGGTIGASSATTAITIASTGIVTFAAETISTTFEPSGDTASGDNAAIGYTAAEGLILTGQGSTSDITFKNDADTTVFTIPTGTDDILFPDDAKILVGTGSDLEIYHDGSHSYIKDSGTGDLKLQGAADIVIEDTSGANAAVFNVDAGQELYWRGGSGAGKKFETTETGATVTGDLTISGDDLIMGTNTSGYILVADGTNYNPVAVSGDVTISKAGAITIASTAVEGSMLNNNVISGQTALSSGVATTDELLISDAGTLKRVDVSLITDLATGDATALAIALG